MCGRYALNHSPQFLQDWFRTLRVCDWNPRYNIFPGSPVPTLRKRTADDEGSGGDTGAGEARDAPAEHTEMVLMRWGFLPTWAEDPASAPMLHNARAETVAEKPMFRQSFRSRRCLIPASGFYEWRIDSRSKQKHPYYVSLRDAAPMSFAGLWDRSVLPGGQCIETCTIITTKANSLLDPIHHRMPVVLERKDWAAWLAADTPVAVLQALLRPYSAEAMQAWEVGAGLNASPDDGPQLTAPLTNEPDSPLTRPVLL